MSSISSSSKEKVKKASSSRKGRDVDSYDVFTELGESIDALSEIEVKMRLEARDTFGKWYVAKVLEVDEESKEVLVHFDRWSSRYDEFIPVGTGRLRKLTPSKLKEIQKERDPVYLIGDRVQAKWEDGKMYFGKVLQVNEDSVDVLFDDGVEYTAPLRSVRKRRVDKPSDHMSDSSQTSAESLVAVEARRSRAMKRSRNEDSQSSMSSPPSSPLGPSGSKRPCRRMMDSDSATETESDFDDAQVGETECPLKPAAISTSCSDGEQPSRRGRGRKPNAREPYRLRKVAKLEPLKEDEAKKTGEDSGCGLLTPPSGDTPLIKPPTDPPAPTNKDNQSQNPNPTPPETPLMQTDSHSDSGILKRMLSQEESPADSTKKSQPSSDSSPRKKPPVSSRTRAQTKFENITKKVEKKDKKQMKPAPKELVIVWDHNEFKCKHPGCNKSFRKESLLQSHVKHYHTRETRSAKTPGRPRGQQPHGSAKMSRSPKSPQTQTSPLSPSGFSMSPRSPRTPLSHDEDMKSPSRGRKPKSVLSPQSRRTQSRSKMATSEVESREKSPTESFFEVMEKEKKSGEVLQLLEQNTKEQKTTPTSHKHTTSAKEKVADKVGGASGQHHSTPKNKGQSSSSSKSHSGGGSKKAKQTAVNVNSSAVMSVAGPPQKGQAVEIRTLSRDSLSHPPPLPSAVKNLSESGLLATASRPAGEPQLNTSDSIDEMDTSNEFEGGEGQAVAGAGEGCEEDVVHCLCGSIEDEGFMIQCEQCLCWQHGDCVGLTEETLPKMYICYICGNPPGLRKRYQFQFDHDWFSEGMLPSVRGGPAFSPAESMKKTHELAGELYKLRKMMHSSKVKLQAASTVNHPYLKQWAKECAHQSKDDIMAYITRFLLPVSYPQRPPSDHSEEEESGMTASEDKRDERTSEVKAEASSCADRGSGMVAPSSFSSLNGTGKDCNTDPISRHIDVSTLHLEPLPTSPPSPPLPPPPSSYNSANTISDPPDPKTLQLAPLPPMTSDDNPVAANPLSNKGKLDGGSGLSSHAPAMSTAASLEVFNDEFGVQEMSVFATSSGQQQQQQTQAASEKPRLPTESTPVRLISSSRSAFRPVVAATPRETTAASTISTSTTSVRENTTSSAESADPTYAKSKVKLEGVATQTALSSLPSLSVTKSGGMETVTLGEFSEAFVKGDTTNWFQRMMLLDHIEAVQDKIRTWMESIDRQLDSMPDDDDHLEDMESLLKNVQTSVEQLSKLQQAAAVS